jgi:hypothetical protein
MPFPSLPYPNLHPIEDVLSLRKITEILEYLVKYYQYFWLILKNFQVVKLGVFTVIHSFMMRERDPSVIVFNYFISKRYRVPT